MFFAYDWRFARSPPWLRSSRSKQQPSTSDPFEIMAMYSRSVELKRRPQRRLKAADKGKGFDRVPIEELDYCGGRFKKDEEYQQSKEMDPLAYAYLIQKEFVSSIKQKKSLTTEQVSELGIFKLTDNKRLTNPEWKSVDDDLSSLKHLDLATGWASSRQVLVEEVISSVFATVQESGDLSELQRLGLPARYLPAIAEAIQADHLSKFKHLDLANSGSLGQKSLELRKLVKKRLPAFLRCKILRHG